MSRGDSSQLARAHQGAKGARINGFGPARHRPKRDAALTLEQRIIAFDPRVERGTRTFAKHELSDLRAAGGIFAVGGDPASRLHLS